MSNLLKSFSSYSRRASFFIPFAVVAGFVSLAVFNSFNENPSSQSQDAERNMASIKQKKYEYAFNRLGKHLSFVVTNLDSVEGIPESSRTPLVLRARVVLTQATASAAKFKWILPEGVSFRGAQEGSLDPTRVNSAQEVEIEVTGFDQTEKKVITFEAQVKNGDQIFGSTALLSSRPQDSMEYFAPSMQKSAQDFAEQNAQQ